MKTMKVYSNPPRFYINGEEVSEPVYRAATNPTALQEMLRTGQTPACITDAALWQGRWENMANEPSEMAYYEKRAKKKGMKSIKGKLYMPALAAFPGDPEAFVDGRGDIKRLLEKRNWNANGIVNHAARNDLTPNPKTEPVGIADDIVDNEVRDLVEANPEIAPTPKERADLREKVRQKRKPHWAK